MNEIWKDVPKYEGYYQVSNTGKIKSLDRKQTRKDGRTLRYKGRFIKSFYNNKGYEYIRIKKQNKLYKFYVHRIVSLVFISNPENKPCVNHIDGNPKNNNVNNLEWCTISENLKHAYKIGLRKPVYFKGETVPSHKLKNEDIIEIRSLRKKGKTTAELSLKFKVTQEQIRNIVCYRQWKHIK